MPFGLIGMHTRVRYWGNREFWVAYELVAVLTGDSHGLSPHRSLVVVTFLVVLSRQTGLGTNGYVPSLQELWEQAFVLGIVYPVVSHQFCY